MPGDELHSDAADTLEREGAQRRPHVELELLGRGRGATAQLADGRLRVGQQPSSMWSHSRRSANRIAAISAL